MYTRAKPSLLDGTPVPTKGLRELAAEALGRLGVETAPTRLGRSQCERQIDAGADRSRHRRARPSAPQDQLQRVSTEV
jgi:hypothetical protein